jgi:2Fe-2S ferredoxin
MAKISFLKNRESIEVPPGTILMTALLQNEIPVASSCGGKGICARCRLKVISGSPENLSAENQTEEFLRERHSLSRNERVSCQVEVLGDVTVDASYW